MANVSPGKLIETQAEFERHVLQPIRKLLERGVHAPEAPLYVAIDTETTRVDARRGFNPFYGVRLAMGSLSWNAEGREYNVAWCSRMRPGLVRKPERVPGPVWKRFVGIGANRKAGRPDAVPGHYDPERLREEWIQALAEREETRTGKAVSDARRAEMAAYVDASGIEVEEVRNVDPEWVATQLQALEDTGAIIWVKKNAKFDMLILWADGFVVRAPEHVEDAEIQSHLTEDKPWVKGKKVSHKLQDLAERHLSRPPAGAAALTAWFEMMGVGDEVKDYSVVPKSVVGPYAWQDTRDTLDLFFFFGAKMVEQDGEPQGKIWQLYRNEMELVYHLVYETIISGLEVDQPQADKMLTQYEKQRDACSLHLHRLTKGVIVDWGSPTDTAQFLFGTPQEREGALGLEVPPFGWTKPNGDKAPQPSSDKNVLNFLARKHKGQPTGDICEGLLEWRTANTFVASFLEPIARFNHDGLIHPDFWLTIARTGRMSASHPNMQNRPKDPEIREIFVPRKGYVLLLMDLDQIEMRIAAHYAMKVIGVMPELWFRRWWQGKPGRWMKSTCTRAPLWDGFVYDPTFDPHQIMADKTGVPRKATKPGEPDAKRVNFLICYGGGPKKMHEDFGWTMEFARQVRAGHRRAYPELNHLANFIQMLLDDRGWIENEYGRRYWIEPDKAYLGLNYLIQGCAADLIKRAVRAVFMILLELREAFEGPQPLYIDNIVHDEVVMEVREDLLDVALARRINKALITHERDGEPIFSLPITAGCEIAEHDWGHPVDYPLN